MRRIPFLDLVMVLCLLVAGFSLLRHLERGIDLNVNDETTYLRNGVRLGEGGIPAPAFGPLYSLWFALLGQLRGDRVALYYLNCRLLTVLLSVGFYVALRRYRFSPCTALLGAGWLLFAAGNLQVWPKPTHFAALVLLAAVASGMRARRSARRHAALLVASLIMIFSRPEFGLTYVLLWGVLVFSVIVSPRRMTTRAAVAAFGAPLFLSLLLFAFFGVPGLGADRHRAFLAFGQHFSLNWAAWHQSPLNPWTNWEVIMTRSFGSVYNVQQALLADPMLFGRHVLHNILRLPPALCSMMALRPYGGPASPHAAWEGLALFLFLMVIPLFARARSQERRPDGVGNGWALMLFVLPGVLSSVLFHPRDHYLLIVAIFLMAWCLHRVHQAIPRAHGESVALPLAVALALVGITVTIPAPKAYRPNAATVEAMRSLEITGECFVLDALGDHGVYAAKFVYVVRPESRGEALASLLARVHLVIRSPELEGDPRIADDPDWERFVADPDSWGFTEIPIPGTPRFLYARQAPPRPQ